MRDIEREKEQILNGNPFVVNTNESTGVFHRDVSKLLHQYRNLRMSLYNEYKGYLADHASQEELMSYIDEQFIKLVKEFSLANDMDFPGYIKIKLTNRVKHSFIRADYRNRKRVFVPRNDFDVSNLIERDPVQDEQLDYYGVLEYILQDVKLTSLEQDILFFMLQELNDAVIERKVKEKNPTVSSLDIRETLKEVQCFIRDRLHKALEEG